MTQSQYQSYLHTDHWQSLRSQALHRDGYQCVKCGYNRTLQVHHLIYRYSPYASVLEDLMTLCDECHGKAHGIVKEDSVEVIRRRQVVRRVNPSVFEDFHLPMPVNRKEAIWIRFLRSLSRRLSL